MYGIVIIPKQVKLLKQRKMGVKEIVRRSDSEFDRGIKIRGVKRSVGDWWNGRGIPKLRL